MVLKTEILKIWTLLLSVSFTEGNGRYEFQSAGLETLQTLSPLIPFNLPVQLL